MVDLNPPDPYFADRQKANRHRAQRDRAQSQRPDRDCTDRQGGQMTRVTRSHGIAFRQAGTAFQKYRTKPRFSS
jgi:hypothetical protein